MLFLSPHFSFQDGLSKSMEEKKNSISGTNEALEGRSGCSFIKCLRKNRPGLPAAAQILAGPVACPLQLEGEGDCGHWCMSVMKQQKTFL